MSVFNINKSKEQLSDFAIPDSPKINAPSDNVLSDNNEFYSRKRFITYFTDYINEPKRRQRKKYKKMILSLYKSISETRLDIDMLNRFADLIKDAEYFFFYDNSNTQVCYSPRVSPSGYTNGFVINNNNAKIITNINLDNNKIYIEIQRKTGDKCKTEISFYNKVFTKLSDEEYLLLLVVSKEIVKWMRYLICETYKLSTNEYLFGHEYDY